MKPQEKRQFENDYRNLVLSELILAAMQEDTVSVRELAKLPGLSPSIIQEVRSGTKKNLSTQSFFKLLKGLDCKIIIERKGHLFSLETPEDIQEISKE